jgi:hypothetical protein
MIKLQQAQVIHSIERAIYEFKESGEVVVDITILSKVEDILKEYELDFYKMQVDGNPGAWEIGLKIS